MVVSRYGESTVVVQLKYVSGCGKSTIKVRQKYAGSKRYVRLKYGKSTVKYGKSTVLYGKFFLAPTVPVCIFFGRTVCLTARLLQLIKNTSPNQLHFWTEHVQSIVKVKNEV